MNQPWPTSKWALPDRPAVKYVFGVSSKNADGDNLIKAFQDSFAEHYGFNDRSIYRWEVEKQIVPKGKEFIGFDLRAFPMHKSPSGTT